MRPIKVGDVVKKVLNPFVKGTRFENCEPCRKRQEKLNSIFGGKKTK